MSRLVRYQLWIAAAASVIFFTNLGGAALFDMDEALYTTCAREMLERGNLIVPWFNGAMFPEKPPLMFWTMMGGFKLFGVNELGPASFRPCWASARPWWRSTSAESSSTSRGALGRPDHRLDDRLHHLGPRATVDSALTFFTALAFLMFVMGWQKGQGSGSGVARNGQGRKSSNHQSTINNRNFPCPTPSRPTPASAWRCLGKGPVGMLLPLAAMGLFLLAINGWRSFFRSAWWMRPFTMILVIAVVAVPWYVAVGCQTNWEWPRQFIRDFCLRPFQKPIQGHGDATTAIVSILYYFYQIPAVLVGFFPWSVFLGPTLVEHSDD